MGSGFATPGQWCRNELQVVDHQSADIERLLSAVAEDALWSEHDEGGSISAMPATMNLTSA